MERPAMWVVETRCTPSILYSAFSIGRATLVAMASALAPVCVAVITTVDGAAFSASGPGVTQRAPAPVITGAVAGRRRSGRSAPLSVMESAAIRPPQNGSVPFSRIGNEKAGPAGCGGGGGVDPVVVQAASTRDRARTEGARRKSAAPRR
jgi:hypothetical protein